jgi:hypothetical protein
MNFKEFLDLQHSPCKIIKTCTYLCCLRFLFFLFFSIDRIDVGNLMEIKGLQ